MSIVYPRIIINVLSLLLNKLDNLVDAKKRKPRMSKAYIDKDKKDFRMNLVMH